MGFRERVLTKLDELGITKRDLAERAGVSEPYVHQLLGPSGQKDNPSRDVRERFARALGIMAGELDETLSLRELLLDGVHRLPLDFLEAARRGSAGDRVRLVIQIMQGDPRWPSPAACAESLCIPTETLAAVMNGAEPEAAVLKQMVICTGLQMRWWNRGRLDPHPAMVNRIVEHDDAHEYLVIIDTAMRSGIPSRRLKRFLDALQEDIQTGEA